MIRNSVGQNGVNQASDVMYVQLLLCDWRVRRGRDEVSIDGVCGPKTIQSIRDFQTIETAITDGLIEVNKDTIAKLQQRHIESMVTGEFLTPIDIEGFPFARVENDAVATLVNTYLSTLREGLD
jgi:hypothetical protein